MNRDNLINAAIASLQNAHAPYSNFPVAAAILMNDGKIITGVNVENASYGATNCAERSAIFAAVSQGYKPLDFIEIAIVSNLKRPIPPCGICRQVLLEFFAPSAKVHMSSVEHQTKTVTLAELVPYDFTATDLEENNV